MVKGVRQGTAVSHHDQQGPGGDERSDRGYPCSVCGRGVDANSVGCGEQSHERCSGLMNGSQAGEKHGCLACDSGEGVGAQKQWEQEGILRVCGGGGSLQTLDQVC
ncbi:hypothetical protein E2C01_018122 [Portunus trituberculatus]|uniref:Uncharacterized protein n=1 Tax=Portunus trituberculatus TaxID=210409 RepID=A0A5B7DVY2_PORTR|nr:hypothetical protein [Portunus trituberculatus]